jgi:Ser/Thr protein kinase RdoA (MazF antagonist)
LAFPELNELLARFPLHLQPNSELESLGGAGGYSGARLWRYRAAVGQLVLRSWPADGPGRAHLERIHRWLSLTADTGLTPVPFRGNNQRSLQDFQGRFWELTPWLPGAADTARPPSLEHRQAAFRGLAALHVRLSCDSSVGVSRGIMLRRNTVDHLLDGGFETIEAAVAQLATSPAEAAAAGKWLRLARSAAPNMAEILDRASRTVLNLQPCLRDARPDHFLFEQARLSGIVDFGAMGVDCVAGDLARLIGEWEGSDLAVRARAREAYEQIRPLDRAEASLISVFQSSADLLIGERWLRWHYLEGRRFEDPQAVAKGLARGLRRLERLVLATSRGQTGH